MPNIDKRSIDDRDLVSAAQKGDRAAFDALVQRYYPFLYRLLFRILRQPDEVEDVAQETFLALWQSLPKFRGESTVSTWLYRVAVRKAGGSIRNSSRQPSHLMDLSGDEAEDPSIIDPQSNLERKEVAQRLQAALFQLPEQQRLAALLFYYGEASCGEISEYLGIGESTVRVHLRRARVNLHRILQGLLEGER